MSTTTAKPTYLGWCDPDKKIALETKLAEALSRYFEKTDTIPTVALMNPADAAQLSDHATQLDVTIYPFPHIPVNTFYVGIESPEDQSA